MKGRAAAWVVWSLTALTVLCTVIHVILWTLAHPVEGAVDSREAGLPIAFVVVGALVVTRRPDNRIGWLFCAGAIFAVTRALDAYALYALAARPGAGLPGATAAAWVAAWSWALGGLLVLLLPLLYPTGRLLSPRWRSLAWLAGLVCLLSTTSWAFRPGPLEASEVPVAPNPVGIPGADQLLEAVDVIAATLSVPVFMAAVASVVVRFRRARGIERQQLKWFVYASLVVVAGFTLSSTLPTLVPGISELVLDLVATGLSLGAMVETCG